MNATHPTNTLRQRRLLDRCTAGEETRQSLAPSVARFASAIYKWPKGKAAPTKYWLSTLPEDTALATLADYAKLRWRIE